MGHFLLRQSLLPLKYYVLLPKEFPLNAIQVFSDRNLSRFLS